MFRLTAAALITALGFAGAAAAEPRLSTRQMEALRPGAANRQVQRDLLSILQPVGRIESGMFRRLHGVGLVTRPFGAGFEGLCRRDAVSLDYAPVRPPAERSEDTPVEPYGITAQSWFHVTRPPEALRRDESDGPVWRSDCDRAGRDEEGGWFSAPDEDAAAQALNALSMTVAALGAGKLAPAECRHMFRPSEDCRATIIAEAKVERLDGVTVVERDGGHVEYVLDFRYSTTLTIRARRQGSDELSPSEIDAVEVEQYITVT